MTRKARRLSAISAISAAAVALGCLAAAVPAHAATTYMSPQANAVSAYGSISSGAWSAYKLTPTSSALIESATVEMEFATAAGYSLDVYVDSAGTIGPLVGTLTQVSSGSTTVAYTGSVAMCTGNEYWIAVKGPGPPNSALRSGSQTSPWKWTASGITRRLTTDAGASYGNSYSETSFPAMALLGSADVGTACGSMAVGVTSVSGTLVASPATVTEQAFAFTNSAGLGTISFTSAALASSGVSCAVIVCTVRDGASVALTVVSGTPDGFVAPMFIGSTAVGSLTLSAGGAPTPPEEEEVVTGPADVLQEIGMPPEGCADIDRPDLDWAGVTPGGWAPSWSQWMNDGNGGAVCARTLAYARSSRAWFVR